MYIVQALGLPGAKCTLPRKRLDSISPCSGKRLQFSQFSYPTHRSGFGLLENFDMHVKGTGPVAVVKVHTGVVLHPHVLVLQMFYFRILLSAATGQSASYQLLGGRMKDDSTFRGRGQVLRGKCGSACILYRGRPIERSDLGFFGSVAYAKQPTNTKRLVINASN